MIQKIRDLVRVQEELGNLQKQFDQHTVIASQLNDHISSLKTEIEGLKKTQTVLVQSLSDDSSSVSTAREELQKEIADFKILKSRVEKKLVQLFEEEVKGEIQSRFNEMSRQLSKFDELGRQVGQINQKTISLSSDIDKFTAISKGLKATDFELREYAKALKEADQEKLELMRKIDKLETLVAKMRRR